MAAAPSSGSVGRLLGARGVVPVLVATAVAGVVGYVVGVLVPWAVPPAAYATFSLVWSTQFLVTAALSGVQQEVSRASAPARTPGAGLRHALAFARGLALVVAVATVAVTALLVWRDVLPASSVLPLTVASAAFGVVAVLTGLLYGLGRTGVVAVEVCAEWLLRCLLVGGVLVAGGGVTPLLWAVALPTLLAPLLLVPVLRHVLRAGVALDVPTRALVRNVAIAVASSVAAGVLISGFPVVMAGLTDAADDPRLPGINLAITLIRSPIVVAVVALQAFLVVRFRDAGVRGEPLMWRLQGLVLGLTAVAVVVVALLGPPVLGRFGPDYRLSAGFLAGLVLASGLLGCLNVSGALALARSRHGLYLAGWVVAAASAAVTLVPDVGDLEARVVVALLVGPLLGLAVQLGGLRRAGVRAG